MGRGREKAGWLVGGKERRKCRKAKGGFQVEKKRKLCGEGDSGESEVPPAGLCRFVTVQLGLV